MTRIDPVWATVAELSRAFDERMLSPVDVVEALLARIRERDGALHAYIAVYEAEARLAAEAADKAIRSGHAWGRCTACRSRSRTWSTSRAGSPPAARGLAGPPCRRSPPRWRERLIAAGMIVLGKTHTVEFAYGQLGHQQHLGTPRNPWDLAVHRTPGGSCSGSAVAVAARLAPCAIGTDTGGSVRLPAGWCGIVGLKTTVGRISTYGVLPLSTDARHAGSDGPLRRGRGAHLLGPATGPIRWTRRPWRGRRRAAARSSTRRGRSAAGAAAGSRARGRRRRGAGRLRRLACEVLAGLGAEHRRAALPRRFRDSRRLTGRIIGAEGYRLRRRHLADDMSLPVDPHMRPRIQLGPQLSARDYLWRWRRASAAGASSPPPWRTSTPLLTPIAQTAALPIDEVDQARHRRPLHARR